MSTCMIFLVDPLGKRTSLSILSLDRTLKETEQLESGSSRGPNALLSQ